MKWGLFFIIAGSLLTGHTMAANEKTVYGYVEKATMMDKDLTLSAKLDTGAKSASLSAINIREVEKDGKTFLQFIVPSKTGNVEFFSEYVGKVRIKVRAGEIVSDKPRPLHRPVVLVRVRLGDKERLVPVNLTNRKRFNYPLLLGREAIKSFDGLVDPSLVFTLKHR